MISTAINMLLFTIAVLMVMVAGFNLILIGYELLGTAIFLITFVIAEYVLIVKHKWLDKQ